MRTNSQPFECKLADGRTVTVAKHARTVMTDMLAEGIVEYNVEENAFYFGTGKPELPLTREVRRMYEGAEPSPGPKPAEPPFYLVTDRSIPPDEVHFRDQQGRTLGRILLATGQVLVIPRKANDTLPVLT